MALLYGRAGEDGETVLRYASEPNVKVLAGTVASTFDAASGDLRLNYAHAGLARVRITGGGRPPMTLLLADEATAQTFWRHETKAGPLLVRGPELLRTASPHGNTLRSDRRHDKAGTELEIWAPPRLHTVNWNGASVASPPSRTGSLFTQRPLRGPEPVRLPDLRGHVAVCRRVTRGRAATSTTPPGQPRTRRARTAPRSRRPGSPC